MADYPDAIWMPRSEPIASPDRASSQLPSGTTDVDESGAPGLVAPDLESPWSVGSTVEFAPRPAAVFDEGDLDEPQARPRRPGRRWTIPLLAVGGVCVAAIVGLVVTRPSADDRLGAALVELAATNTGDAPRADPLVPDVFAGADSRRLPDRLDERWSADIDGVVPSSRSQLTVVDAATVIGIFDDATAADGEAASVIISLDAEDGSERWRSPFRSQARAFNVLGSFGGVVAMERLDTENRAVLGLDAETGDVLWVRDTNDPGVHVVLEGTELVTWVSFTGNARLTFIDPQTGDEVGRVPGRLFATDFLGTWYVRNGNIVSELDLRNGWTEPEASHRLAVTDRAAATVVDDRLLELDGGVLQVSGPVLRADAIGTAPEAIEAERSPLEVAAAEAIDVPASFQRVSPMAGNAFVLSGDRAVFGASLGDDSIELRWRAEGAVIDTVATDRGLALVLGADGGAKQQVVDASTGNVITQIPMVPGAIDALQLVGNGVVVKRPAAIGHERVGLDLDGNRRWSLVGEGPLAIGPSVVVTHGPTDAGVNVTAYGLVASIEMSGEPDSAVLLTGDAG